MYKCEQQMQFILLLQHRNLNYLGDELNLFEHFLLSHTRQINLNTSANLKVAAQPLPYFPLRASHKQANLSLPTHAEWLLLTRLFGRVHEYVLTESVWLSALEKQCVLKHQLD